jgi:uncharacterized membrane protein
LARKTKSKKRQTYPEKPPIKAASLLMPDHTAAKATLNGVTGKNRIIYQESYSGPVPHPSILSGLDKVVPGSAKQVMDQFVAQGEHRREMERKYLKHENIRSLLGVIFAGLIVICSLAAGTFLVWNGKELVGSLFSAVPIGTVAWAFIYGTKSRQRERLEKSRRNPPPPSER